VGFGGGEQDGYTAFELLCEVDAAGVIVRLGSVEGRSKNGIKYKAFHFFFE
jgi:hypothetical protein